MVCAADVVATRPTIKIKVLRGFCSMSILCFYRCQLVVGSVCEAYSYREKFTASHSFLRSRLLRPSPYQLVVE